MASKKQTYVWWVKHPDHTVAVAIADSWEQATVQAAEWWEVPWGKVAALCECEKKEELVHNVCCDCGNKMWGDGKRVRCGECESIARDQERTRKARDRRFFGQAHTK